MQNEVEREWTDEFSYVLGGVKGKHGGKRKRLRNVWDIGKLLYSEFGIN